MATQAQIKPSPTQAPVSQASAPEASAAQPIDWGKPRKREWGTALRALVKLLGNADDTVQVFRIMRALNGDTVQKTIAACSAPRRAAGSPISGSNCHSASLIAHGSTRCPKAASAAPIAPSSTAPAIRRRGSRT